MDVADYAVHRVSFKLHPLLLILFFYSSLFQPFHINPFHSTVVLGIQPRQKYNESNITTLTVEHWSLPWVEAYIGVSTVQLSIGVSRILHPQTHVEIVFTLLQNMYLQNNLKFSSNYTPSVLTSVLLSVPPYIFHRQI